MRVQPKRPRDYMLAGGDGSVFFVRSILLASFFTGLSLAAFVAADARALVWPDVPDRVERQLASADPSARRAAAHELQTLGPARGSPLVLRALSDPDEDVRLAAADSAIRLRVVAATDVVIPWLNVKEPRPKKKACDLASRLSEAGQ